MLNVIIAAITAVTLGTNPAAAQAVVPTVETCSTQTYAVVEIAAPEGYDVIENVYDVTPVDAPEDYEITEIPDEDVPLALGPADFEIIDAVAAENGFAVAVDENEALRVYSRTTDDATVRVHVYENSVFVQHVDHETPDVLDGGYAFRSSVEGGVLTCHDGFDVGRILRSWN